jgi:RND family efflux transporter MFP subunit
MESPDHSHPNRQEPPKLSGAIRIVAVVTVIIAAVAAFFMSTHRSGAAVTERAKREAEIAGGPLVRVVSVVPSAARHHLTLLGEARPYASVTLYAKVSGYLKSIAVDKGDRVRSGQLLAQIEAPETDAAWSAAKADHAQRALTATRVKQLLARKYVSPQEADQASSEEAIAASRLESLTQQREYENLRAPFDGTVTARFADPGALMQNAATSQTSALPVVTIEQTTRLRVYAYLDQADAANVHPGMTAALTMDERPGVRINASVTRTSGELDPKTRKLLVELDVDNTNGSIIPGSFLHVELDVPAASLPEIPAEALVVRHDSSYVAVVAADSTVHFRRVTVTDNDGRRVRLLNGAAVGDQIAVNVGDALADGARVRPARDSTAAVKPK